jgi:rhodanese-related sulfurtransferase
VNPSRVVGPLLAALLLLGAAGCASDDTPPAPSPAASAEPSTDTAPVEPAAAQELIAAGAEVIDVRTPEEFEAGHLPEAVNLDYQAPDFAAQVAELPRDRSYVVCCASGNRAAGAVEQMRALGFTEVVNAGGYEDLRRQ